MPATPTKRQIQDMDDATLVGSAGTDTQSPAWDALSGKFTFQRGLPHTRKVWFTGDSITRGNINADTAAYGAGLGGDTPVNQGGVQFSSGAYQTYAMLASAGLWTFAGVFATAGLTAAQILSTHVPQIIAAASRGDVVVVLAGTNGNDLASTQAIHDTLRAAGLITVVCTLPPSGAAGVSAVAAFNAGLKMYAATKGLLVCDFHAAVADSTTGAYQTVYNGDGVHPNAAGYRQMGYTLSVALAKIFSRNVADLVDHNTALTGSLQTKPLALAAPTNGVDYGSLSGLGTSTIAVAADAEFVGGSCYQFTRGDTDINGILKPSMTFVQGHRMRMGLALKATVTSGTWGIRLESNTTGSKMLWGMGYPSTLGFSQTIARFYSEFTVPTLPDYGYRTRITVTGAGTVLSLSEVTVWDLTAMGLA